MASLTSTLGPALALRHSLYARLPISPIMGLSPIELEMLLDNGLPKIQSYNEGGSTTRARDSETSTNYYRSNAFHASVRSARSQFDVSRDMLLKEPQIIVEQSPNGLIASYNKDISERLQRKLERFQHNDKLESLDDQLFSLWFTRDRQWIEENQAKIVQYLVETQKTYLKSGNPLDLKPLHQKDVAEHIGYGVTSVSRLVKNLTLKLPDGRVLFADDLIPGISSTTLKGVRMLEELAQDPDLFENGTWKVASHRLAATLKDRYGVDVARRTVAKYQDLLEQKESSESKKAA